jgi:hypothetical protein
MGNCYGQSPEYTNEEIQRHLRTSKIQKKPPVILDSDLSDIDTKTEKKVKLSPLLQIITDSYIESLIEKLNDTMNNFEVSKKTKIIKKNLKTMDSPFELYFKQENYQPDPEIKKRRLHNMFARIKTIFPPSISMLYELNTSEELMKEIDNNMKDYKVIRSDKSKDSNTIIQILLMTTKKFLIVQSKCFLTMRVFRRISDNEYVVVGESVLRNDLSHQQDVKNIRKEASNECEIFLTGSKYGGMEGDYSCCNLTRGDFQTTTGNVILKPIFKKTFNKYYNKNLIELINFILRDQDIKELVWFGDEEDVRRVINEARRVLLDFMHEVPDLFDKEWTKRLEELRESVEQYENQDKEGEMETRDLETPLVEDEQNVEKIVRDD